ncbi:flavin-containing monooxygenase [Pseudoduganella violaceinigra]|uniref:flavin-containing monooxygenase n=1 Tax=Pseudoduganella violaceinigra TaxID=246602 RepID=UPI00042A0D09|nr:NAD(P)/FAD-dependent oxidoreductase [Pseudoduganella violaceinigra]
MEYDVVIVGSGFGGLCSAIKLKEAGIDNFVILEKDEVFGGTWRVNTYPGAACDIPSHLYSFSFAQNARWSRLFPRQDELLEYTLGVVRDYGLEPHLRLGTALRSAQFDEAAGRWRISTSKGEMTARTVIFAIGLLGRPSTPQFAGAERFRGQSFHSAQWDHSIDLRGKRVAVVGSGASAVQFVPEIQPLVRQLDHYQRTAHWVLPRPDRAVTRIEQWLLQRVRPLQLLFRAKHYVQFESRVVMFIFLPMLAKFMEWQALRHLKRQVADPQLRDKLTPNYTLGCKRVLLTNDYYPALAQPNVAVLKDGIREICEHGIVTGSGEERPVDVIIYATGFDVEHAYGPIELRGRGGCSFAQALEEGAGAYKGATVAGFPNFFMITGPNTLLGHNSMIYMIESGVRYAVDGVRRVLRGGLHSLEVRPQVQAAYNQELQRKLKRTVWHTGCNSWYLDSRGRNLVIWPGFTFHYRHLTRRFDIGSYIARRAA